MCLDGERFRSDIECYNPFQPSIDKIAPELGYVNSNVVVTCLWVIEQEVIKIGKYL